MSREYYYEIKAHGGLSPIPRSQRNTMWCSWVMNGRIVEDGGIESVGPPLLQGLWPGGGEEWPFPQLVVWGNQLLALGKNKIYRIKRRGHQAVVVGKLTVAETVNHPWSMGLVGKHLIATNYQTILHIHPKAIHTQVTEAALPPAKTMCAWHQRWWFGNAFAYGIHAQEKIFATAPDTPDLRMELYPGGGGALSLLLEVTGEIVAMRPQDQSSMLVGGTRGLEQIYPTGQEFPRYGRRVISDQVGVMGPLAMIMVENRIIFLGTDWNLYEYTDKLERLGYAQHLEAPYRGLCPTLSVDRSRGDIYISY